MAINPLLSQATSRVAELQRNVGDEKRRQDSAASFLSRTQNPGGQGYAANDLAVGGQGQRNASAAGFVQTLPPQGPDSGAASQPAFQPTSSQPAVGDRQNLSAGVGFSVQQLAQEGGQASSGGEAASPARNQRALAAYNFVQQRGGGQPSGPQIITESGLTAGFGAYDNFARLNLSV